ncbi:hypothetical protein [Paenibacillus sp. N3.4]|uniref:hypothetical protein n=1 Tax=Paenibacillus sp. N3.4 TaxID=2603222 RepID=UPI0011C90EB8|nr:hypothetical protein [Paenibacillus sp. N3.4]TXK75125.1 hypothetical protein FU659_27865 [Paenibacillus sp. N3.4]
MSMDRSKGLALVLIAAGLIICIHKLGMHGHLMGILMPIIMVGLGYVGITNGKKIGWLIAGVGAFILVCKLSGFLAIAFAICLVVYGIKLLKRRTDFYPHEY